MQDKRIETEVVIVGSGTGGATLAKELSKRGKKVILIEKGKRETKVGRMRDSLRFYDGHTFQKSKEGTVLYGTNMVGGTSVVASGNALPCLEKEFLAYGIDLKQYLEEAMQEIRAVPLPDKCIAPGVMKILESSEALGLNPERIPKFINPEKCVQCGNCVLGCRYGAKWSAINFVDEAVKNGIQLFTQTRVIKVLSSNGSAKGVEAIGPEGRGIINSDMVIISAGGINTPRILQSSGIHNAGKKLFCDPFMTTYGVTKNLSVLNGVNTPYCIRKPERFTLFPVVDPPVQFVFYTGWRALFGKLPRERTIGMMTKIADEYIGRVDIKGRIEKPITSLDKEKFNEGNSIVRDILNKSGIDSKSIYTIKCIRGAHPGGTAAIGEVVNNNLETEIKNLYVCDSSVLPKPSGLPPILTIIALSKWLSTKVVS